MLPGPLRDTAAHVLYDMASILRSGGYPVGVTFDFDDTGISPLALSVANGLRDAMARFAEQTPRAVASSGPKVPASFFLSDAFTNPEHVQYALKTTAAAMFCYCLYTLLDWPGIHTSFITCYIVALTTAAEAVEKLMLRVIGCLVGAAIGIAAIVFLMPS